MRTFVLRRLEDVSGVSGTGVIAEGVEFHDGQTVLSWFGQHHCVSVWYSVKDMLEIHGHQGKTMLEWDSDKRQAAKRGLKVLQRIPNFGRVVK